MTRRACNLNLLRDTADTFHSVSRSLPPATRASVSNALRNAQAAANRGHCADMHKNAQHARGLLERRLDVLLGRGRR